MKVTLITAVYNAENYIKDCVESVCNQTYPNIEYIIIDGASTDRTMEILRQYENQVQALVSEPDRGMYDALNKGISLATGDIVGILNADDMLASNKVIEQVVRYLLKHDWADGVYGNLNYIDAKNPLKIIRRWISKPFKKKDLTLGWMPAHPTVYLRKEIFDQHGNYALNFGTAADYEFMVRLLYLKDVKLAYLNELLVGMRVGGMSNASLKFRWHSLLNDYRAMKKNSLPFPLRALFLKKVSKLSQFIT